MLYYDFLFFFCNIAGIVLFSIPWMDPLTLTVVFPLELYGFLSQHMLWLYECFNILLH